MNLELDQMDIVTAILYRDLNKDISMEVLEGRRDFKRVNIVCKLLKSLYGLKHASRQQYVKINSFLVDELEFNSS